MSVESERPERATAGVERVRAALRGARAGFLVALAYGALALLVILPIGPLSLRELLLIIMRTYALTLLFVSLVGGLPALLVGALTGYVLAALLGAEPGRRSGTQGGLSHDLRAGVAGAGFALLLVLLLHLIARPARIALDDHSYMIFLGLPGAIYICLTIYAAIRLDRELERR